jgi:mannosyl-oligosaccharide glucosidase
MKRRRLVEVPALSDDVEEACPPPLQFYAPAREADGSVKMMAVYGTQQMEDEPELQLVPRRGYVSLFPLLLRVLPADSPKLLPVLRSLRDDRDMWTAYGLRSLSARDTFYGQPNAPGDAAYWRGPIWININYLALGGLFRYAEDPGCPHRALARELYEELRSNVVKNVFREWDKRGFFFEQYNDKTGEGQRAHPFSGWTSTVLNIMAELY